MEHLEALRQFKRGQECFMATYEWRGIEVDLETLTIEVIDLNACINKKIKKKEQELQRISQERQTVRADFGAESRNLPSVCADRVLRL